MSAAKPSSPATGAVQSVLVVDDEADIRQLVSLSLQRIGIDTHTAANLAEARELLATYAFGACLTDMRMPDGNGVDFVAEVASAYPDMPIAVITAHGQTDAAVRAMKNGAFDFVSKPVDLSALRKLVEQALSTAPPRDRSPSPFDRGEPPQVDSSLAMGERLVGTAPVMQRLRERIAKVARSNAPVWITGESGTGKELIARLVHANGPRRDAPFVAINCGAIPAELVESELFGHMKGAFTGAHQDKHGLFRAAQGGTLFLDEVAELPLAMQVKLLRAIQERSVRPVGAHEEHEVDVRLLSASHEDLTALVERGRFRQDLYYRLNVISIRAPALRDRPGDIAALAATILSRLADLDETPPTLEPDALASLARHAFPGNVRELENVLERAWALCETATIGASDLEFDALHGEAQDAGRVEQAVGPADERTRILDALDAVRWNRRRAATRLGLSYRQLRYRIARYGLEDDGQSA